MSNSKNLAFIARASDLKRLKEINFDQTQLARDLDGEFLLNGIIPLSLGVWLVTSVSFASGYRHYVFDAQNLRFIDEAAIDRGIFALCAGVGLRAQRDNRAKASRG